MRLIHALVLPVVLLAISSCAAVGSGQVGVLWTATSGTKSMVYGEGLHPVAAWNKMYVYDLRSASHDESLNVLAINGLSIKLGATIHYHVLPSQVVAIQEQIGPQYYEKLIRPLLGSEARRIFSRHTPEEIYSTKRAAIESEIQASIGEKLAGRHIMLEGVLIREIELPASIRAAIDSKLAAEQKALEVKYTLDVARVAAEQKQIEAQAIADYHRTVKPSLSPDVLEYERLQQLSKLATSNNAKEVVFGPGSTRTPLLVSGPR